jgi:uncharacterized repeat protein (TIGR03803 family)
LHERNDKRGEGVRVKTLTRIAFINGAAVLLLSACGGSQPPISEPVGTLRNTPAASGYNVVYDFTGGKGGSYPEGALVGITHHTGALYGTALGGGKAGLGTAYQTTTSGQERVLYRYSDVPQPGILSSNGMLYGVSTGGSGCYSGYGCGFVYSLTSSGAEKVVYAFQGGYDGDDPIAPLLHFDGWFYGTTGFGGTHCGLGCGNGTVYKVNASGDEEVLHRFTSSPHDGRYPDASLIELNGAFYGTTLSGGRNGIGTVFSIMISGKERVLYSFKGRSDGSSPVGALVALNGMLYGTTEKGGDQTLHACGRRHDHRVLGCGTIFKMDTSGNEQVIYRFSNAPDGANPLGNLLAYQGALYGVAPCGGNSQCPNGPSGWCAASSAGCGVLFKVTTSGVETVLHRFSNSPDGSNPLGGLIAVNGTLYGTTAVGGAYGKGTIYQISP